NNGPLPVHISLLCHGTDEVERALAASHPFFRRLLLRGKLLYGTTDGFPSDRLLADDPAPQQVAMSWEVHYRRAASLSEAAAQQGTAGFTDTQIPLLQLAFEQLLRGLVHRSLGYTPKDRSLLALLE